MVCPRVSTEISIRDYSSLKLTDVAVIEAKDKTDKEWSVYLLFKEIDTNTA